MSGGHVASSPDTNASSSSDLDLPAILGRNLRRLRTSRGHSLERLAKQSGVSRAMLGQIETGKAFPPSRCFGRSRARSMCLLPICSRAKCRAAQRSCAAAMPSC
ncbi:helix-turn-helix domain-containing protein [Bradyrhizobium sp. CCGB20]|uniref:helix-turn-helix domain-containing protein n=1 Tax=Bradyrhizobium sp. CCGB20 TaxID=2949633 RepID=UPI0020B1D7CD|nr:helix-turn-helix domain-containing protein [Bradyrhizobium sp. CCGB20]MCP3398902.1 helix-turn-helix domain-containing protein [Bradyrhizobium sp. CCGB20]